MEQGNHVGRKWQGNKLIQESKWNLLNFTCSKLKSKPESAGLFRFWFEFKPMNTLIISLNNLNQYLSPTLHVCWHSSFHSSFNSLIPKTITCQRFPMPVSTHSPSPVDPTGSWSRPPILGRPPGGTTLNWPPLRPSGPWGPWPSGPACGCGTSMWRQGPPLGFCR